MPDRTDGATGHAEWVPQFVCRECASVLVRDGESSVTCVQCAVEYRRSEGIWRFLDARRGRLFEPFATQYRLIREREGYRAATASYYQALPYLVSTHEHATHWAVRRETYERLRRLSVLSHGGAARVLDLGAGNGWLSHRLAEAGHAVVALDTLDDDADGLGVKRLYATPFTAVQSDFDALPFAPSQFDVVIFNASLHYAPDPKETAAHARSMLVPEGLLIVMDSPLFQRDRDGRRMVEDMDARFRRDYGLRDIVRPGGGYLTFALLSQIAARLGMRAEFFRSHGPLGWRLRRRLGGLRLRRAPAMFGMWVASSGSRSTCDDLRSRRGPRLLKRRV